MHNGSAETIMQLLNRIKEVIQIRLAGLAKVVVDHINRKLCYNWGLDIELIA